MRRDNGKIYIYNLKTKTLHIKDYCCYAKICVNDPNYRYFAAEYEAREFANGQLFMCKNCSKKRDKILAKKYCLQILQNERNDYKMSYNWEENQQQEQKGDNEGSEKIGQKIGKIMKIIWISFVVFMILGAICVAIIASSSSGSSSSSHAGIETCGSCGRSFKSSSANGKSIRRTGMCSNCYSNYEFAQGILNERPVD